MSKSEDTLAARSYPATAAIVVLIVLTGVMLLALTSRTAPHPPLEIPLFALGPFLGASLAIGAAAIHVLRHDIRYGSAFAILFALTALVSFGPQKYFDPVFSRIWPVVITAQIAVVCIAAWCITTLRRRRARQST